MRKVIQFNVFLFFLVIIFSTKDLGESDYYTQNLDQFGEITTKLSLLHELRPLNKEILIYKQQSILKF